MRFRAWIVAVAAVGSLLGGEPRFFPQALEIPERGLVTSYVLIAETNRFTFLPPPKWQVNFDAKEMRSVLTSPDLGAAITLQIVYLDPPPKPPIDLKKTRAEVLNRYPDSKVVREIPCYLSALQGIAFDLDRPGANGVKIATRQALIPFPGGMLEFSLTTPKAKFESYRLPFSSLLTSFRIEPWTGAKK